MRQQDRLLAALDASAEPVVGDEEADDQADDREDQAGGDGRPQGHAKEQEGQAADHDGRDDLEAHEVDGAQAGGIACLGQPAFGTADAIR